ncbi:MAG: hypothetical protein ACKVJF_06285, partial [Flavobacteriales bacterium]
NYMYSPIEEQKAPVKISFKNDVKQIKEKETDAKKSENVFMVKEATSEQQTNKDVAPEVSNLEKVVPKKELTKGPLLPTTVLYAQVINNGYQLVDASPKIILRMLKSTLEDVFIAESLDLNGVVYKRNNKWYFEYNKDGKVVVEELQIKF